MAQSNDFLLFLENLEIVITMPPYNIFKRIIMIGKTTKNKRFFNLNYTQKDVPRCRQKTTVYYCLSTNKKRILWYIESSSLFTKGFMLLCLSFLETCSMKSSKEAINFIRSSFIVKKISYQRNIGMFSFLDLIEKIYLECQQII